ncbi:uncharacterized protein ARMOST_11651 [Armillaria ostoyae]|uniref:Uncharacterized protein n=1 Tax=Armillaria ostoyae TaxID=47428 RepID=A0A284RHQ1_ARMOS|nr:uncharacterized protein ARMOST_11651 [Armillaria ostoyae]
MSDTPPPPYLTDKELYQQLAESASHGLTPEELVQAQDALAHAAANPQNTELTVQEINALIREGVNLDHRLQQIHGLVEKVKLPSTDTAGKLQFNGDLLDLLTDPDETPENKLSDLNQTWNVIKSKGDEAEQQPEQFNGLLQSLDEYSKTVQDEIEAEDSQAKEQIQVILLEIAELEKQIEELETNVVKPLATMLQLTNGVFNSLLSGSPKAAFDKLVEGAIGGILALAPYKTNLRNKSEERRALQDEVDAKRDELHALEKQQAIIGNVSIVPDLVVSIHGDIAVFAKRLTAFTGVFDQLEVEYKAFVSLLESNTPVTDPAFTSRVSLIRMLLPQIASALDLYSRAQAAHLG